MCCHSLLHARPLIMLLNILTLNSRSNQEKRGESVSPSPPASPPPAPFSPLFFSPVRHCTVLTHPWREKPGVPLSDWGAPLAADNSRPMRGAPCCDSCRAVSLICGHSCSLAAFVVNSVNVCVCVHIDG